MLENSILLLLGWGALAFGAEYAWAYTPLIVFSSVPALMGLRAARGAPVSPTLMLGLGLVFVAGLIQAFGPAWFVPHHLQAPPSVDFGRLYALVTMGPPPEARDVISIAPTRTILGLTFLAAFTLLFAGCTRGISAFGPKRLIRGIVILGGIVAFVALIQAAVRTETIYGFWRPPNGGVRFAPFINENHFTGWMAMVVSLAIGSFVSDVVVALDRVGPGWRNRVLWFSSARASGMILTAFAVGVMALSMVAATSRGGLVGLLLIFAIGLFWILRRQSGWRRLGGVAVLLLIIVGAMSWGNAGRTLDQFAGASNTLGDRRDLWADAWRIVQDYPVTGTGLNTFGIAMLHYQTASIEQGAVVEAHNDYLQIAAEGGLLVGLPILLVVGIFCRQVWLRFREHADDEVTYWRRVGSVTGLCVIAIMSTVDFTLQMPGAAAMFVVLAAIAVHRPNYLRSNS